MKRTKANEAGFTIIEMLVVIAIVSVLAALIIPAVGGAQRRARKAAEVNAIRQLGIAWNNYATANNDGALPGYLDNETQQYWRVHYDYPDGDSVPKAKARSWVFRLAPYFDSDHDLLLGYRDLDEPNQLAMSQTTIVDPPYDEGAPLYGFPTGRPTTLSDQPAFGYNAYYIGGWWEMSSNDDRPQMTFSNVMSIPDPDGPPEDPRRVSVVVTAASSMRRPSELILFCSSSILPPGQYEKLPNDRPGSYIVVPPTLADEPQWEKAGLAPGQDPGTAKSDFVIEVLTQTSAPIARYNRQAALLRGDLSTEPQPPGSLDDQQLWINAADRRRWTHTP